MQPADSQNTTCITTDLHCTGSPACILGAPGLRSTTGRGKACFLLGWSQGENEEIRGDSFASVSRASNLCLLLDLSRILRMCFHPPRFPTTSSQICEVMVQVPSKGPLKNHEPIITWHGMRICTIRCNQGYIKNCQSLISSTKFWDEITWIICIRFLIKQAISWWHTPLSNPTLTNQSRAPSDAEEGPGAGSSNTLQP